MSFKHNTGLYIIGRQVLERYRGRISPNKIYYLQEDRPTWGSLLILDDNEGTFWISPDDCKFIIKVIRERPLP